MTAAGSDVFHYQGLPYWGPIGEERVEHILDFLDLEPGAAVLDIGCGSGELLVRIAERTEARTVGIDRSAAALAQARERFDDRVPATTPKLIELDANAYDPGAERFDAISWLGGPYIGGDFDSTLRATTSWLRPGGYLLVGHGFWHQVPPGDYLAATGIEASEFTDHIGNIERAEEVGLRLMYCSVSNRDEWDRFEGTIIYNVERYAAEHPDAPDPQGRLEQRRTWNRAQQRWGRQVMGFGLYLFRAQPS